MHLLALFNAFVSFVNVFVVCSLQRNSMWRQAACVKQWTCITKLACGNRLIRFGFLSLCSECQMLTILTTVPKLFAPFCTGPSCKYLVFFFLYRVYFVLIRIIVSDLAGCYIHERWGCIQSIHCPSKTVGGARQVQGCRKVSSEFGAYSIFFSKSGVV